MKLDKSMIILNLGESTKQKKSVSSKYAEKYMRKANLIEIL